MKVIDNFVLFWKRRLQEPSTWGGLILLFSAFVMELTSEQQSALGVIATILMTTPDKGRL